PLSWGVNAALYSHGVVFVRTGVWVKRLALVPLERIQSAGVGRGPWQRALGLRSFSLHSVSGPVPTRVLAVDENEVMTWWEQTNARMVGAIGQGARTRSKRSSASA
ncbi:MAG: PH domain-containing protein, partial [Microbacteriaceae bacterium]|nr:PH domain-containing protein [Microbacteriaceae bacterium]